MQESRLPCGRFEHLRKYRWWISERQYHFPHHSILLPNFYPSIHNSDTLRTKMSWRSRIWNCGAPTKLDDYPVFIWWVRQSTKDCYRLSIKDEEFLSFSNQKSIHSPIGLSTNIPFKASRAINPLSFVLLKAPLSCTGSLSHYASEKGIFLRMTLLSSCANTSDIVAAAGNLSCNLPSRP